MTQETSSHILFTRQAFGASVGLPVTCPTRTVLSNVLASFVLARIHRLFLYPRPLPAMASDPLLPGVLKAQSSGEYLPVTLHFAQNPRETLGAFLLACWLHTAQMPSRCHLACGCPGFSQRQPGPLLVLSGCHQVRATLSTQRRLDLSHLGVCVFFGNFLHSFI